MKTFIELAKKKRRAKHEKHKTSDFNTYKHESFQESKKSWYKTMKKKHHSSSESDSELDAVPFYLNQIERSSSHSSSISWDEYGQFAPIESATVPTARSLDETKNTQRNNNDRRNSTSTTPRSMTTFSNDGSVYSETLNHRRDTEATSPIVFDFVAVDGNNIIAYKGSMVKSLKRFDENWWKIKTTDGHRGLVSSKLMTSNQVFGEKAGNPTQGRSINVVPNTIRRHATKSFEAETTGYYDTGPVRDSPVNKLVEGFNRQSVTQQEIQLDDDPIQCIYEVPDEMISYRANIAELLRNKTASDYKSDYETGINHEQYRHSLCPSYSESCPTSESDFSINIHKTLPEDFDTVEERILSNSNTNTDFNNSNYKQLPTYEDYQSMKTTNENKGINKRPNKNNKEIKQRPRSLMHELNLDGKVFKPIRSKDDMVLI